MRDIGKNIRQLRLQKRMTQDLLAERLFVTRQTVSNYETGKSRPDVEMLIKIAEVLGTDIQQLIYGPEPKRLKPEIIRLIVSTGVTALLALVWMILQPVAMEHQRIDYEVSLTYLIFFVIRPLTFTFGGWTLCHLVGMALRRKPFAGKLARRVGAGLLIMGMIWFAAIGWYGVAGLVNEWQYGHHIRGEWMQYEVEYDDGSEIAVGWSMMPPRLPAWLEWFVRKTTYLTVRYPLLYSGSSILFGVLLWLLGIPVELSEIHHSKCRMLD